MYSALAGRTIWGMFISDTLNRIIVGAMLTGVAIAGLGPVSGSAHAQSSPTPLVWQMDDPNDPPPPPGPPPPPPPPRQCWALFLPAPCPPPPG
jgi:hypothetical protein